MPKAEIEVATLDDIGVFGRQRSVAVEVGQLRDFYFPAALSVSTEGARGAAKYFFLVPTDDAYRPRMLVDGPIANFTDFMPGGGQHSPSCKT